MGAMGPEHVQGLGAPVLHHKRCETAQGLCRALLWNHWWHCNGVKWHLSGKKKNPRNKIKKSLIANQSNYLWKKKRLINCSSCRSWGTGGCQAQSSSWDKKWKISHLERHHQGRLRSSGRGFRGKPQVSLIFCNSLKILNSKWKWPLLNVKTYANLFNNHGIHP